MPAVVSQKWAIVTAGLWLIGVGLPSLVRAEKRAIDVQRSVMKVYAYKSGFFSVFAHNHEILAPIAAGTVEELDSPSVELRVDSAKIQVLDPKVPAKDRAEIQKTMHSPEVLDTVRYTEIRFQSLAVEKKGDDRWAVQGNLELHGQTRPVAFEVTGEKGHYRGAAKLKQSEFAIKPVSVAGGTVKVKDEILIEFDILLSK